MKIELTEDEVREIGGGRYTPSRKYAIIWGLSFIATLIGIILLPKGNPATWHIFAVFILFAIFVGMYILLLKRQSAAGRPSDMRVGHLDGGRIVWDKVIPAERTLKELNRGKAK